MTRSGFLVWCQSVGTPLSAHSTEMRNMRGSVLNMNTQRAGLFGPFPHPLSCRSTLLQCPDDGKSSEVEVCGFSSSFSAAL